MNKKLKQIIEETLVCAPDAVTADARLVDDLGADSLDLVELVMACEEEWDIDIPDDDAEKVETVGDLEKLLDRLTEKK